MARTNNVIGIELGVDVTTLKTGLAEANKRIKESADEFKLTSSTMENWQKSADGVRAKVKQLTSEYSLQELKLRAIQEEYDETVKSQGENSKAAQKLKSDLQKQQVTVNKSKITLNNYNDTLNKVDKGEIDLANSTLKNGKAMTSTSKSVNSTSKSFNNATKSINTTKNAMNQTNNAADALKGGFTVLKGTISTFIGTTLTKLTGTLKQSIAAGKELRKEFGMLSATANSTGANLGSAEEKLRDIYAITEDTGAAVEGMNNLMTAGFDGKALDDITDQLLGASVKWKDTLKFEGLADGLQETLATNAAVGPFSELLERGGANLDDFNAGLEQCTTDAERQNYVMKQLSKLGLTDVLNEYENINDALIEENKVAYDNTKAMARLGTALSPLIVMLQNITNKGLNLVADALEKIKPQIDSFAKGINAILSGNYQEGFTTLGELFTQLKNKFMVGISSLFSWMSENIPMIMTTIVNLLSQHASRIVEILPKIIEAITQIIELLLPHIPAFIQTVSDKMLEMLPLILSAAQKLWNQLLVAIPPLLDKLLANMPKIINTISGFVKKAMPMILSAATDMFNGLVKAIPGVIKSLTKNLPGIINAIVNFIKENLPTLLAEGGKMLGEIIAGLVAAIPDVVSALDDFVKEIFNTLLEVDWLDLGGQILDGIIEGLKNVGEKVKNVAKNVGNKIKDGFRDFFGINSPSKLMEQEVGEYIGEGVGSGILKSSKKVLSDVSAFNKKIQSGMNVSGTLANAGINANNVGQTINYTQIINSTKEPTIKELSRYTSNLLDLNKLRGGLA